MSNRKFVNTAARANSHVNHIDGLAVASKASNAERKPRGFGRPDFTVLASAVAIILLLIGFGVVAIPLAVHDLPLLLR